MAQEVLKRLAISDDGFVFDPNTGFTYTLNGTARAVLELLKTGNTATEIVAALVERFEVDQTRAERELVTFLGQLREFDLLDRDSPIDGAS